MDSETQAPSWRHLVGIGVAFLLALLVTLAAIATTASATETWRGNAEIPVGYQDAIVSVIDDAVRSAGDPTLLGVTIDTVRQTLDGGYIVEGWLYGRPDPFVERTWSFTSRLSSHCDEPLPKCWHVERVAIDAPIEPLVIYPVLQWDRPAERVAP